MSAAAPAVPAGADRAARRRIAFGFTGGGSLTARAGEPEIAALRAALDAGRRLHDLRAEDGLVVLALPQVAWVHIDEDDQRLGFG